MADNGYNEALRRYERRQSRLSTYFFWGMLATLAAFFAALIATALVKSAWPFVAFAVLFIALLVGFALVDRRDA